MNNETIAKLVVEMSHIAEHATNIARELAATLPEDWNWDAEA